MPSQPPNPGSTYLQDAAWSAVLFVLFVATWITVRGIALRNARLAEGRALKHDIEVRRRWLVNVRNSLILIFIVGLAFIWAHELRTFAVSLVAIAAALVLATKELIQCVSGSIVRAGSNAFTVGDRIEVDGLRGRVIDLNILSTTVLEIGPGGVSQQFTGRAITFPNSVLVTRAVVNESYLEDFVLHMVRVPLMADEDWQAAERALLDAARAIVVPYLEDARRHLLRVEGKSLVDFPSIEPKTSVEIPAAGQVLLLLRMPAPATDVWSTEQAVLRRFLETFPRRAARTS